MTQEPNAGGTESPAEIEQEIARTRARLGSTLDAIEDRLSPEHLMEQGMAYLREEAGEWGAEIGDFMRRNPIPVAVLGVGIGLVAYSAMRPRQVDWDDEFGAGPEGLYGPAHAGYGDPYSPDQGSGEEFRVTRSRGAAGMRGKSGGDDAGSGMMDRVSEMGSRLGSRAQDMRDTISEHASGYADEASSRLGDLWNRASDLADSARELAEHARERVAGIAGDTRESVGRIQTEVVRTAEERPLLLGAIGLGAGLLIGLCLPSTRAEARTLGRRRDELVEGVRQAGAERLHGVVEAVRHAGEAVLDQVKEEGFSREGLSSAMDKVQRVAESALDTAAGQAQTILQVDQGATDAKGQESGQNAGQGAAKSGAQGQESQGKQDAQGGPKAGPGPAGPGGGPGSSASTGGGSGSSGGAGTSGTGSNAAGAGATGGQGAGGSSSSAQGQGNDSNKGASSTTPKP